jgi:type IV pilus assembly protein PilF
MASLDLTLMRGPLLALVLGAALLAGCQTTTTVEGETVGGGAPAKAESDPRKRVEIRLQLAATYYQQRQYQVALEEAQRALQIDLNSAFAYGMIGLIYMDLNDPAQAEANFGRALRIEPQNPEINNNYGWFLCRTRRERESLPYFERAVEDKLYVTPSLPLLNAGMCMMQIRDYKLAEGYLRRSFERDATNPAVKYQLARLYLTTRQLERARFYYGLLEKDYEATAETLWLGLRIARAGGDSRTERQLADQLQRRFPSSREAGLQRRGVFDE